MLHDEALSTTGKTCTKARSNITGALDTRQNIPHDGDATDKIIAQILPIFTLGRLKPVPQTSSSRPPLQPTKGTPNIGRQQQRVLQLQRVTPCESTHATPTEIKSGTQVIPTFQEFAGEACSSRELPGLRRQGSLVVARRRFLPLLGRAAAGVRRPHAAAAAAGARRARARVRAVRYLGPQPWTTAVFGRGRAKWVV